MEKVHIDFLKTDDVKIMILFDDFSKWIECWIMNTTKTSIVLDKLEECFCRFSYPIILICDNGPPFNSSEFKKYFDFHNIKLMHSPPYNPTSNGVVERAVQSIKKLLLRSVISNNIQNRNVPFQQRLNKCSYRFTPSRVTKYCPAEICSILNHVSKYQC